MTERTIWSGILASVILTTAPGPSETSYSPPLTRVRIDKTQQHHTPSYVFATQTTVADLLKIDLQVNGVQYLGQFESRDGYGIQVGLLLT